MNHEPLLGMPYPRMLHAKLLAMREAGVARISALGGLTNPAKAPYWPNPKVIQAAQFFPEKPVERVLGEFATRLVGADLASALTDAWQAV